MIFVILKNGGDFLRQQHWYAVCMEVQDRLERLAHKIEGTWATESISPFQSACWGFAPMPDQEGDGDNREDIREMLATIQSRYGGAMYWVEGELDDIHGVRGRNK